MHSPTRAASLFPALVASGCLLLSGCSGEEPNTETKVPTRAADPYLCPGVPRQGAEEMTGALELKATKNTGAWGGDDRLYVCAMEPDSEDPAGRVTVIEQDLASASSSLEALLEENKTHLVMAGDADSGGVAYKAGNRALARYVCGDRYLSVAVHGVAKGRDGAQDVANYLVSMLPWACRGETVPAKGEEG